MLLGLVGCGRISIAPSCPQDLRVGEAGAVDANVRDPGAIPSYLWQVIPSDIATLDDPLSPTTTFTASAAGEATFRLTASDGIFQVVSECRTTVVAAAVEDTPTDGDANDGRPPRGGGR